MDGVAEAEGAGGEGAGVDAGAAVVVLGEVAKEGGVGEGGLGGERDDAAAGDALSDAELGGGAKLEGVAGEAVFGEEAGGGVGVDQGEDDVGAEAAGVEGVAELVGELGDGVGGMEGDGADVGERGVAFEEGQVGGGVEEAGEGWVGEERGGALGGWTWGWPGAIVVAFARSMVVRSVEWRRG